MKVLKWLGLVILGIILFFSLTAFGLAFTVKQTALNPHFYEKQINKIPLSQIFLDNSAFEMDIPTELKASLDKTIVAIEPQLKEETRRALTSVFDYLNGKKANPELAQTLRNTVLSDSFVDLVIDNMDLAAILEPSVRQKITEQGLPQELTPILDRLGPILVKAEPQLKAQLKAAVPGILDYVLGVSDSFSVTFNANFLINDIKTEAKTILRNDPAFAGATDAQLNAYIDNNLSPQLADFNNAISLDQSTLGSGARLTGSLNEAEDALAMVKPYIVLFNRYYILLIVLIILVAAGIAAIHHSIKGATRSLGSILIAYGFLNFIPLLIFKYYIAPNMLYPELTADVPAYLDAYVRQSINAMMAPIWWFSLGCLIAGIALLVVSFVYHPAPKAEPPAVSEPTPQS